MLIGTDVLCQAGINLDFQKHTAKIGNRVIDMSVTRGTSREGTAPEEVFSTDSTVLLPKVLTPLAIRPTTTTTRSIFVPNRNEFMTQLIDSRCNLVYAYNATNIPSTIPANKLLGTLDEANGSQIQTLPRSQWMRSIASFATDTSSIMDTTSDRADRREMEGPFGTTMFGDSNEVQQLGILVSEFQDVFTDSGDPVIIPKEDWLSIPLVPNWEKVDTKLTHRVYPMGPKDRELIDKVHDKLHEQSRMEWCREPSLFGFPVFVVWKNVEGKRKGRVVVDIRGLNKVALTDA